MAAVVTGPGPALTRARVGALLRENGLRPSRALGQNFLVEPPTAARIARMAAIGPGDRVLEIGAGLGSLTVALAATGASVTAVEMDRRLVAVLRSLVSPCGVRVVEGDAMRLGWGQVLGPGEWVVVANLPYNMATPLVLRLLEEAPAVSRLLVMVQAEVGERMAARAGDPAYGAVSVKVAYWATASVAGKVPRTVFLPRPNVDSVLVAIRRREAQAVDPAVVPRTEVWRVVEAGFAKRRKMLRGALSGVVDEAGFAGAGVSPRARAEELDVEAWGRLAAYPAAAPRGGGAA